jgi:dTDP-4-dehydrorhamnose 3,5-epimerase
MKISKGKIAGLFIIEPDIYKDPRGFFCETYSKKKYFEAGINADFVQDNISASSYGVIRGLHYQTAPSSQAKLVSVVEGKIFDVAIDLRKNSPAFAKWEAVILEGPLKNQFYIPAGFAHGFCVLSEKTIVSYKSDDFYAPSQERGILWNDPEIAIDWPIKNPVLSDRDKSHPPLKNQKDLF